MRGPKTEIDYHIGRRIRLQRHGLGMGQEELANKLNVSYQQVQKYENGSNCVSIGRLLKICVILGVPLSFMFEGAAVSFESLKRKKPKIPSVINEALATRQGLQVIEAFHRIQDAELRRNIARLVVSVADTRS